DKLVTGVQTCALPIYVLLLARDTEARAAPVLADPDVERAGFHLAECRGDGCCHARSERVRKSIPHAGNRRSRTSQSEPSRASFVESEERRVGKEWRAR